MVSASECTTNRSSTSLTSQVVAGTCLVSRIRSRDPHSPPTALRDFQPDERSILGRPARQTPLHHHRHLSLRVTTGSTRALSGATATCAAPSSRQVDPPQTAL